MPTVQENKQKWDGAYQWPARGDEWSLYWGGPSMQWYGTILPRIHRFVPAASILEIGCGQGRWTDFLKNLCQNLTAIDLSQRCIEICRDRFREFSHIDFHVNDGMTFDMVQDESIDFIFSFDSLVHAYYKAIDSYVAQFQRILKVNGIAFIHHSNLGEYVSATRIVRRIPKLYGILKRVRILDRYADFYWRDQNVSAKLVEQSAQEHGMKCVGQELMRWGAARTNIDCITTLTRQGSSFERDNRVLENKEFSNEIRYLYSLSDLYAFRSE